MTSPKQSASDAAASKKPDKNPRLGLKSLLVYGLRLIFIVVLVGAVLLGGYALYRSYRQQHKINMLVQQISVQKQQLIQVSENLLTAKSQLSQLAKQPQKTTTSPPPVVAQPVQPPQMHMDNLYRVAAKIQVELALSLLVHRQPASDIVALLNQAKRDLAPLGHSAMTLTTLLTQTSNQIALLPTLSPTRVARHAQWLSAHLFTLQLISIMKPKVHKETPTPGASPGHWHAQLASSWHWLRQFLVVRHDDHISQNFLYLSDRLYFMHTLDVLLQQAVWASWQGNTQAYQQALTVLRQRIERFTQAGTAQTRWLSILAKMQKMPVAYPSTQEKAALTQILQNLQVLMHRTPMTESEKHA